MQLDFCFDFYRQAEWQFRHPDGASSVRAYFISENADDEVAEPIDHGRLLIEPWRRVHHAEYASPSRDPIEIPKLALQASQNREAHEPGRQGCLFLGHVRAHFPERPRERTILVRGAVTRDQRACTHDSDPGKQKSDPRRKLQWLWQDDAESFEPFFYG